MDKKILMALIKAELERELATLVQAAQDAHDAATNEESKAENQYDTRGLEASYLAGAQAKRASEVEMALKKLLIFELEQKTDTDVIGPGSLVQTVVDGEQKKWFFLLPVPGGIKVKDKEVEVTTLTRQSPVGENLFDQKVDHIFEMSVAGKTKEYEIIKHL